MDRFAWLLGLRGVVQHAKRNLIAGFAIGVGLMAILTLIGYSKRVEDYLAVSAMYGREPGHVAIVKRGGLRKRFTEPAKFSLKGSELVRIEEELRKIPGFDFDSPYLSGYGLIGNGCQSFPFRASAFLFDREERIRQHPDLLRVMGDYRPYRQGVSHLASGARSPIGISTGLAERLGKDIARLDRKQESVFTEEDCQGANAGQLARDPNVQLVAQDLEGRLNAIDGELVNEFTTGLSFTDNTALTMGLKDLQELLRSDRVSYVGVFLKDSRQAKAFAGKIKVAMIRHKIDIDAYAWDDKAWNFNYYATRNILYITNVFAAVVIFIVVILSIINTLNIGLIESRREIGTLRSLGFTPSAIASIFAIEAKCVALLAVLVGGLASFGLFRMVTAAQIPFHFPGATQATTFLITPPEWAYPASAAGLILLVISTNFIIARRYAKQDILPLLDRGN